MFIYTSLCMLCKCNQYYNIKKKNNRSSDMNNLKLVNNLHFCISMFTSHVLFNSKMHEGPS